MRRFALLLLIFSVQAWATTYYVRPVEAEYGAEDGSSYAAAYDGFADVNTAGLLSGDTVLVCGSFDADSKDQATVMMSVAQSGVTWDGDCSGDGDLAVAVIDGQDTASLRGFDSGGSGSTGITIQNMTIQNFATYAIISQGTDTTDRDWIVDSVTITNAGVNPGGAIDNRGGGLTIRDSTISLCSDDCVYTEGVDLVIQNTTITGPSQDSVTGDNIVLADQATTFSIQSVTMTHASDVKQCLLVQDNPGTIGGTVIGSSCDGPSATAANHTAFYFDGTGTVNFFSNYAEDSQYLAYAANGATLVAVGNVGRSLSNHGIQCGTSATACLFYNNTIDTAPICYSTGSAGGTSAIRNNIGVDCTTVGIRKNAGDGESYNNIYSSLDVVDNDGTTTAAGTGTVTTDPLFGTSSPITKNQYRLSSASPLRDAGTAVGWYPDARPTWDYRGTPTIGAWEFGSGDPSGSRTVSGSLTVAGTRTAKTTLTAR